MCCILVLCCWTTCWWVLFLCIVTYIIDTLTCAHLNLPLDCHIYVSLQKKVVTVFFVSYCLTFYMRRNKSDSLTRLTTDAEDPYQPFTILLKIRVNNSSKIFTITSIREKFCRDSVPVNLQFLVLTNKSFWLNYILVFLKYIRAAHKRCYKPLLLNTNQKKKSMCR